MHYAIVTTKGRRWEVWSVHPTRAKAIRALHAMGGRVPGARVVHY